VALDLAVLLHPLVEEELECDIAASAACEVASVPISVREHDGEPVEIDFDGEREQREDVDLFVEQDGDDTNRGEHERQYRQHGDFGDDVNHSFVGRTLEGFDEFVEEGDSEKEVEDSDERVGNRDDQSPDHVHG